MLSAIAPAGVALLQAWSPPVAPVALKRHQQQLITSLAPGELPQRVRIGRLSVEKPAVRSHVNTGNARGPGDTAPWKPVTAATVRSFAWGMSAIGLV